MDEFDDAKDALEIVKEDMLTVEVLYQDSIEQQEISRQLKGKVKSVTENLRSALDYTAQGLFKAHGNRGAKKPDVHFPYAPLDKSASYFVKRLEQCIPGLQANRPDIAALLTSYQHFAAPENRWLPVFLKLNNQFKHERLVPHSLQTRDAMRVTVGNCILESPGLFVGREATVNIGGQSLPPRNYHAKNLPPLKAPVKAEIIVWTSLHFDSNGEEILESLKTAQKGVTRIVDELSAT